MHNFIHGSFLWRYGFSVFFSAKKYALGESHLACSVSIFVLADESLQSLVSLLCVVAMFDLG